MMQELTMETSNDVYGHADVAVTARRWAVMACQWVNVSMPIGHMHARKQRTSSGLSSRFTCLRLSHYCHKKLVFLSSSQEQESAFNQILLCYFMVFSSDSFIVQLHTSALQEQHM